MGIFDFLKSKMSTSKKEKTQKKDVQDLLRVYVEDPDVKVDMSKKDNLFSSKRDYVEYQNNIVKYKGVPFTGILYDLFGGYGDKIELWKEIEMKDGRKHGEYRDYSHGLLDSSQEYENGEKKGEIVFHLSSEEWKELDKSSDNPIYRHEEPENTYVDNYNILNKKQLQSLIDEKGYIHNDICIKGSDIRNLGEIKKLYGTLNIICNKYLKNLGELNYIKKGIWGRDSNLTSLGNLEKVGGSVDLKGSSIKSLGKLTRVGGKLTLRDTKIKDLGVLKYVGKDLYLPKRLEGIDLNNIEIKGKVRYWNDKNTSLTSKVKKEVEWDVSKFSEIHNLELKTKTRKLTGEFLVKRCYELSELNEFIIKNIKDFFVFVDNEIDKLYNNHYSFYQILFDEIKSTTEINNEFPKVKFKKRKSEYIFKPEFMEEDLKLIKKESNQIIKSNKTNPPFDVYFKKLKEFIEDYGTEKFKGYKSLSWVKYNEHTLGFCESTGTEKNSFIFFMEDIIVQLFSVYVYSLQNDFRVSKGIPKIGEGWVSETELFYLLKENLPSEKIIHHGKPKWLGRQHVDIWFPKRKIGIEYQGLQHDKPVDFFGGEEGFIEGQKRDLRKKELFKENNSILIEVRKDYKLEDVVNQIKKHLK